MKRTQTAQKNSGPFLLAFAWCFTTAVGNIGPVVVAADDDTFVEVTVPNGDFESEKTAWTFTGDIQDLDYYWRLFQSNAMTNNLTTMYEVCSKKEHKCNENLQMFTDSDRTGAGYLQGIHRCNRRK